MKTKLIPPFSHWLVFIFLLLLHTSLLQAENGVDPLPSWNEGRAKNALLEFVREVTHPSEKNYIPPEERIVTFDQDGTLWVEQPMYTQLFFAIDRLKTLPSQDFLTKNQLKDLTEAQIERIVGETHAGMTVDQFHSIVQAWLKQAIHPRFKKPFTDLVYQPMREVIAWFRENGFKIYIVSGGGQEFMRAYAQQIYGIPPEQIIGSAGKTKYENQNGKPVLIKLPQILIVDDHQGKPETINLMIGKRPVAAFGNSDGDREMLEWTQAGQGKRLQLLVHHDDAIREYAYGEHSKVGTFSASLMDEAIKKDWIVVSMKNDWKIIFSWEKLTLMDNMDK